MRRPLALLAAVVLVSSVAACEGFGDVAGISFRLGGPDEFPYIQRDQGIPFTASGWHVGRDDLCDSGIATIHRFESAEGEIIDDLDWADMFDTAMENEGTAEAYLFQVFECNDGSGSFSMTVHVEYDFDGFEFRGEQDIGSWEIEEGMGTGSYSDLSGSGGVALDWDEDGAWYGGDIFP